MADAIVTGFENTEAPKKVRRVTKPKAAPAVDTVKVVIEDAPAVDGVSKIKLPSGNIREDF